MPHSLLIVVPTLDSYELLPRLIDSLVSQSWVHWRLVFVDGHSGVEHRRWLESCCAAEPRCSWLMQSCEEQGIFGAMNQGFVEASPGDWVLFLGSDDWLAGPDVLSRVFDAIYACSSTPDLLVCRGRYFDQARGTLTRSSVFRLSGYTRSADYRRALFLGSTPPHQSTLIGPGARRILCRHAPGFRLSGDLDYFLQLSTHPGIRVECIDLEIVHISDGGVSGQQTMRRLQEVRRAYRRSFGWLWCFPFVARYIRRLSSLYGRT